MGLLNSNQLANLSDDEIWNECDHSVRIQFSDFIKEFNKREWSVRIGKTYPSFEKYAKEGYEHKEEYGTGFVIDDRPIPYFHPNRSFHDEVIWLNDNLYYDKEVNFENKLVNSAIVKFYGPSRTLSIITGHAEDLPYLQKTDTLYIDFTRLKVDKEYEYTLISNIETASAFKEQLWGTTELRTSLQVAARNYARTTHNVLDERGLDKHIGSKHITIPTGSYPDRKMRTSDMILWIKSMADDWVNFYNSKPTMKESYEYLTLIRGIGPYYGYHFSSNLSRMPGIGYSSLIEKEHSDKFNKLGIEHGKLDEDADYVVAGPGACYTLKRLFPNVSINNVSSMALIIHLRDNQHKYLDITSEVDYKYLTESTELGRFTTFGTEIACCQFSVFDRLKSNAKAAAARANAPISKEVGKDKVDLTNFFE